MSDLEVPKKVAIYIRVSTEDQVEKYGVELQKVALMGLIASKGTNYVFAGEEYLYIDEGVSGVTELQERPAFARLLEDITYSKPFDLVAVYKIDRFARKLRILLDVLETFESQGIGFISANESIDTTTPFGKAMLGILGVIAELELETIKERTHSGREEAAKKGVFMGPNPPYGFTKNIEGKLIPLQEESKVVKEIFEDYVYRGYSIDKITKQLRDKDTLTPGSSAEILKKYKGTSKRKLPPTFWRYSSVRKILDDELYIGKYYYGKNLKGKSLEKQYWKLSSYFPPKTISDEVFFLAQEKLKKSAIQNSNSVKSDKHIYVLSSLLSCAHCFNPLLDKKMIKWTGDHKIVKKSGKHRYYYKCSRKSKAKAKELCTALPLPANELEEYVFEFLKELLVNPIDVFRYQKDLNSSKLEDKSKKSKIMDLEKLIDGYAARKGSLLEQHKLGFITTDDLKRDMSKLEVNNKRSITIVEELKADMAMKEISKGYLIAFEEFQKQFEKGVFELVNDRDNLRSILSTLIEEIVVFSRPLNDQDVIAGRRREGQALPYKLQIKLRLPSQMLNDLYIKLYQRFEPEMFEKSKEYSIWKGSQRFGGKEDTWWAARDSNP